MRASEGLSRASYGVRFRWWIEADAGLDRVPPALAWTVFTVPILGWAALTALFVATRPVFYLVQQEDHVVEWTQFGLLVFSAGAVGLALPGVGRRRPLVALALGLLMAGLLFLAGEEISWGQRVLGIETPPALAEANQQAETNLHNINVGIDPQVLFKVVSVGLGAAGLLATWLVRVRGRGGAILRLLAPPLFTAPGFVGIALYWPLVIVAGPQIAPLSRFQEWVECALYVSLAAAVGCLLARIGSGPHPGPRLRLVAVSVVLATVACALLSAHSGIRPGNV